SRSAALIPLHPNRLLQDVDTPLGGAIGPQDAASPPVVVGVPPMRHMCFRLLFCFFSSRAYFLFLFRFRFLCTRLTSTASVVDCLEAVCELRLICLGSHSTVAPSTFDSRSCFLDSDGRVTSDSRSVVSV
ncbi:hypothetical protein A2U01_0012914, partial [Trifolium medium]|nr:hypothetical protein [Trifolium medium]